MHCKRCNDLCDDVGEGSVVIGLFYDYQALLCHDCLPDYLLQFMPELAKLEIETDVLDALMRSKNIETVTVEEIRKQSVVVNTIAQELVRKVMMWIKAGN